MGAGGNPSVAGRSAFGLVGAAGHDAGKKPRLAGCAGFVTTKPYLEQDHCCQDNTPQGAEG